MPPDWWHPTISRRGFAADENRAIKDAEIITKNREGFAIDQLIKFNGTIIGLTSDGSFTMNSGRQAVNISLIQISKTSTVSSRDVFRTLLSTKEKYVAHRARGAYIVSICQSEASFDLSYAVQMVDPSADDVNILNKRLQWQLNNPKRRLTFVKLYFISLK